MSPIDDTIAALDALLDRVEGPTETVEVTYRRGDLIFQQNDVSVFGVESDSGSTRGLLWVEDGWVGPTHHVVIEATEFRTRWPMHDRRKRDDLAGQLAAANPGLDRRAA